MLYDALVLPPVEAAGTPSKSKGMLRCDIAATPPTAQAEVRASILALLTAGEGCVWLAHTPQHDLSALGLSEEDLAAQGVVIVDIGQLALPPSGQVRSLKKARDILYDPRSRKLYNRDAKRRYRHSSRPTLNTLVADLAGARKPRNVVEGRLESGRSGRSLLLDEVLVSADGSHEARFEVDGNFRIRESGSKSVVWERPGATPTTAAHGFGFVQLQKDGNLVLYAGKAPNDEDRSVLWSSVSADPAASESYLELDDDGGLRVHRRTADNAYAPCAWGSMGCGGGLTPVRNSLRVLLRSMFYPSALKRTGRGSVLSSLVGFLRRCVGL